MRGTYLQTINKLIQCHHRRQRSDFCPSGEQSVAVWHYKGPFRTDTLQKAYQKIFVLWKHSSLILPHHLGVDLAGDGKEPGTGQVRSTLLGCLWWEPGAPMLRRRCPSLPGSSVPLSYMKLHRQTLVSKPQGVTTIKHFKPNALFTAQSRKTYKHLIQVGKLNNI